MAQLTLTERSTMANDPSFQHRLTIAAKKTANFWKDFVVDTFTEYNVAIQKRKAFARQILQNSQNSSNILAYAEFFLSQYNEDPPIVDGEGNLTDDELTDSTASSATFDYFSGVETGDDVKQIVL